MARENAARLARYDALSSLCTTHRVELLLTAHHQDDQAETVMLQALRGAGLPGWSGMADLQRDHALVACDSHISATFVGLLA
jgi:tRNA(Ile)-lysidine synthase